MGVAVCRDGQRGSCSYGKKLRYVQQAGAIAMLVIGTDNLEKYQQVFQIHEGDPLADDPWPENEVRAGWRWAGSWDRSGVSVDVDVVSRLALVAHASLPFSHPALPSL